MKQDIVNEALKERFLLQKEYLGDNKPVNRINPLVSITVATYQHVDYIKQCLDGILMQKTNFLYEVIIGEDGSVDGTQEICKEYAEKYPDKIRLYIRDRKLSQFVAENGKVTRFNGIWNRMSAKGKYIALCEGDDYWIDALKLQKQVDFLERNPEYGLVHTYFNYVDVRGNIISPPTGFYKNLKGRIFDGYIWDYYLVNPGFILTCTSMYRRSFYLLEEKTFLDHGLFMMIARQSKTYCLRETTAAYRRNPAGAMCTALTYYSNLCQRAILYQLYYYMSGAPCCDCYKKNRKVADEIEMAYTYTILKCYKILQKEDWRILINITCKKFSLLLQVPFCLAKIAARKMVKRNKM